MPAATNNPTRLPAEALASVERRVLWLSSAMVDHADNMSENPSGLRSEVTRHRARRWSRSCPH